MRKNARAAKKAGRWVPVVCIDCAAGDCANVHHSQLLTADALQLLLHIPPSGLEIEYKAAPISMQ